MKTNLTKSIYYLEGARRVAGTALLSNSFPTYLVDKEVQKDIDEARKYNEETDKEIEKLFKQI